jgi:thimet oligopeptidase
VTETPICPWNVSTSLTPETLETWVNARLDLHHQALSRLTSQPAPRTIENTLRHYDDAIFELASSGSLIGLLDSVFPDKAVRDAAQVQAQKISHLAVELALNRQVYDALSALDASAADPATRHYLDRTLLQYRLAGVDKDEPTRARLKELQDQATLLSLTFSRNVQEGGNTVTIDDPSDLDGLPPDFLQAHKPAPEGSEAAGKITLTTDFPDYLPVMTFARSHDLRLRMFLAYNTRAFPQNKQILLDLLAIRKQIANLLGFSNWADLATADQMMESAVNMQAFLDELDQASRDGAEKEYALLLNFSGQPQIDACSRGFWLEQYRRSAFDFDSQSVRPYFPYDQVQHGALATAAHLFQVEFRPAPDTPTWHADVTAFDVYDRGTLSGRFYLDMHPREGKDKWFSAHPLIPGISNHPSGTRIPEAALICNFPGGPSATRSGDPGLMQHSDVVTFFHEFGHLMHALLGGRQRWAGISGIATEGDFVEVPSQMLEEFFRDPALLATFARHYQTGEPIPAELVHKMNRAGAFGRADSIRTQLFYTTCSLKTHSDDPATLDLDQLFQSLYTRFLPYQWIPGNRMYSAFTHLVGYSSNYYTYLYDKVIALDFFAQFAQGNLLDDPISMKYRRTVLEPGGSLPGKDIVHRFLGRPQSTTAFADWMNEEFQPQPKSKSPA